MRPLSSLRATIRTSPSPPGAESWAPAGEATTAPLNTASSPTTATQTERRRSHRRRVASTVRTKSDPRRLIGNLPRVSPRPGRRC